jgi:hypothetical protein
MKQRLARKTCSKEFRDLVLTTFPRLKGNEAYMKLLQHILYGNWRDSSSGNIIIPHSLLADFCNKDKTNFSSNQFLQAFSKDVCKITYTYWSIKTAREISSADIPQHIYTALHEDRLLLAHKVGLVDFVTGKVINNAAKTIMRTVDKEQVLTTYVLAKCREAVDLLEYMNSLDPRKFSYTQDTYYEHAQEVILALDIPEQSKNQLLDTLRAAQVQPKPFYGATERSVRIYPRNDSILNLPRNARYKLTKGLWSCDLKSAQIAVISKTWDIPELHDYLSVGSSTIWHLFYRDFNIPEDKQQEFKIALKKAIYSIVFGMSTVNLVNGTDTYDGIAVAFAPYGIAPEAFLNYYYIKLILTARHKTYNKINRENGAYDVFGNWINVTEHTNAPSIAAQVAQSYELKLLYPVIQLARTTSDFTIMYWLHDGFYIYVGNKEKVQFWIDILDDAVCAVADELDIPTFLEIEHID